MAGLNICLLGAFRASLGETQNLKFKSIKDRALLAYLAVEEDRAHSRDSLAALLWPEMPDSDARSNLRYTLSSLRRTIGDRTASPSILLVTQDSIQLNVAGPVWVDVQAFKEVCSSSRIFDPHHAEQALQHFKGPFMDGFLLNDCLAFENWQLVQRAQLNDLAMDAFKRLAGYYEYHREYGIAAGFARQQIALEPWNEVAQRQLMRLLAFDGQRSEALAQYERLRTVLWGELAVEPEPETERIMTQIRQATLHPDVEIATGHPIRGYELKECIGTGHMGRVYRAFQPSVGRDVAIKVIQAEYAARPAFIRHFELEARLVARLEHPHIVPLYDFWREPEGAFLVMRWLQGGSLADALAQETWPFEAAARLLFQIAAALHMAHQIGVIHRDIKPANILLDSAGNGYLSDFGIAALLEPAEEWGLAVEGSLNGLSVSSSYVSPELLEGASPTPAADIYSLGVVLFELLSGQKPVTAPDRLIEIREEALLSLPDARPEILSAVAKVIQRATALRPEERYSDALDLAYAFQQAARTTAQSVQAAVAKVPLRNPFKGLRAFEEVEADEFFGRNDLTAQILKRLSSEEPFQRFLALVGPSGCGKSSLLQAGLLSQLRRSEQCYFVTMTPGGQPFTELAEGLLRIAATHLPGLKQHLRADVNCLVQTAADILPPGAELLLAIDQFEELYAGDVDQEEQDAFLDSLSAAVMDSESRVRVLIILRADFFDRPLLHPRFSQLIQKRTEVVVPFTVEELTATIEQPLRRIAVSLEDGLTHVLVADVKAQPGALPLLQYALTELFEHRQERILTHAAYEEIGGVTGAVIHRAEAIYISLPLVVQAVARQMFLRLIVIGDQGEAMRRRVLRSELAQIGRPGEAQGILEAFGKYRLLTFDHDPLTRQPTVEVAHEALLREWGRIREWLDESRADVRQQRMLVKTVTEWCEAGRDPGFLLRGTRLTQMEEWAQTTDLDLTMEEKELLEASLAQRKKLRLAEAERQANEAALERRSRIRLRIIAALMFFAAVIAVVFSILSVHQQRNTLEAYSLSLTANAQTALEKGDTATALVLALAATDMRDPPLLSQQTLLDAAFAPGARASYDVEILFPGVTGQATALAISPDGEIVFIGFADGNVIAWDWAAQKENLRFAGHAARINAMTISAGGVSLLTAADDGQVIQWDASTGLRTRNLIGHTGAVRAVDISTDGYYAVTGSFAGTSERAFDLPGELFLWDLSSGELVERFEGHRKGVIQVQFVLEDGAILASSGDLQLLTDLGGTTIDGVLSDTILWDIASGEQVSSLETLEHDIHAIEPMSDTSFVLLGSYYENVVSLFDLDANQSVSELRGHNDAILALQVSGDGRQAITASKDSTLIVWDLSTGELATRLLGHTGPVTDIAVTPDFRTAFSISANGELIQWDLHDAMELQRFIGHGDMVYDVALLPGEEKMVSVSGSRSPSEPSQDTSLRIWDIASGRQLDMVSIATPVLFQVAVSPDGKLILTNDLLFDAQNLQQIGQLKGHDETLIIPSVAISLDGRQALTGGTDGQLILWDLATQEKIRKVSTGIWGGPWAVAFSDDGRYALSDSDTSLVDLYDLFTGEIVRSFLLEGYSLEGGTSMVLFHPDGESIFTAGLDGMIYQFDLESGELLQNFGPHNDIRTRVAISPERKLMVSSGMDGVLMLWNLENGNLIRRFGQPRNTIFDVTMNTDGTLAYTGFADGTIIEWQLSNPSMEDLRVWIAENRFVRNLSCEEQELFQVKSSQSDVCGHIVP
jgi:WD40 repeat protein/serine/threonine protein kinase